MGGNVFIEHSISKCVGVYVISTCVSSEAVTRECAVRVRVSECGTLRVCV